MSKVKGNILLPELRFPEFHNSEGWIIQTLGEIYSFLVTNSYSREYLTHEKGEVRNIHYGDIHKQFSTLFDIREEKVPYLKATFSIGNTKPENYCKVGDMIFADASEDMDDVGKSIEIINLNDEKVVSGLHTLLARQKEPKLIVGFGGYLFKSNGIRAQIQKEAQGAKVYGISAGRLSHIEIHYPQSKVEQQKIAGCLSSIDDLITAQRKKVDALRAHKKGLMQQLFPAEGENVPKLRFSEFQVDGDWVETALGKISKIVRGGSPRPIENFLTSNEDGLNWLKIGDVSVESKFIEKTQEKVIKEAKRFTREVKPGDLILSNSMSFGRPYILKIKSCIHDGWIAVTDISSEIESNYLYYLILSNRTQVYFLNAAAGGGVRNLKADIIKVLPVSIPSSKDEQQKIADCLSSIDELISAQSQRLESLKAHKKGLMQGLFPAVNNDK